MDVQSPEPEIISLFEKDGKLPELRQYKRHEQIVVQGENARYVFLQKTGVVKIVRNHDRLDEMIMSFAFPDTMIGWAAMLSGRNYQATAIALEPTTGWLLSADIIRHHFANIGIKNELLHEIIKDTMILSDRVGSMAPRSGIKRFLSVLIMLADVYGISDDSELKLKLTIKDLAEIVLLSRETIHRLIRDVEADSIISIKDKKVIYLDFEKLKRMSEA